MPPPQLVQPWMWKYRPSRNRNARSRNNYALNISSMTLTPTLPPWPPANGGMGRGAENLDDVGLPLALPPWPPANGGMGRGGWGVRAIGL